jgi:hypothetical protein
VCAPAGTAYGYADLVALLDAAKGKEVPLPTQNGGDVLVRPWLRVPAPGWAECDWQ